MVEKTNMRVNSKMIINNPQKKQIIQELISDISLTENIISRDFLEKRLQNSNKKHFIQIGVGVDIQPDYFSSLCHKFVPERITLFEPRVDCNNFIKNNYCGLNYNIINKIVTNDDQNEESMFICQGCSSILTDILDKRTTLLPATNLKKEINSEEEIDLLYIDIEAFDTFIIEYIFEHNLHKKIRNIVFEQWSWPYDYYDQDLYMCGYDALKYMQYLATKNNFSFNFFVDKSQDCILTNNSYK